MAKETEVKAKLTLDDKASAALAKIVAGLRGTATEEKKAQSGMADFARQAAAAAVGMNFVPAIRQLVDFGKGFVDAARAGDQSSQALAGLMTAVQNIPFDAAKTKAGELSDEFDAISIKSGATGIGAGFQALVELSGASAEGISRSRQQIEQMATVSGVLGLNTEGIAREFGFMQEGALKTKGQMFQLLQQTGIFGNDVKKAGLVWSQMSEEDRASKLAYGLELVSAKLTKATPSFNQLLQSIENTWEATKQKLGEPIMGALSPALKMLMERLSKLGPTIQGLAMSMSKDVAGWVTEAAGEIEKGFKYLQTHKDEIAAEIKSAMAMVRDTIAFILAHKAEIAIAFGAGAAYSNKDKLKSGFDTAKGLYGAAKTGISTVATAGAGIGATGLFGTGAGLGASAAGGAAIALGALAAAIVGVGAAAYQGYKLFDEYRNDDQETYNAKKKLLEKFAEQPALDQQAIIQMERLNRELLTLGDTLGEQADAVRVSKAATGAMNAAQSQMKPFDDMVATFNELSAVDTSGFTMIGDNMALGFNKAMAEGNTGVMGYIANLLSKNVEMQAAFVQSGILTGDAFDFLINKVQQKSAFFIDNPSQYPNIISIVCCKSFRNEIAVQSS